jgi:hypothetical protein
MIAVAALALTLLAAQTSPASSAAPSIAPSPAPTSPLPIISGSGWRLARAHWEIRTSDPQAQDLFDRGLVMLYAFDVGEARVAFGDAIARDPNCAMCYWGIAESDTIDINLPSTAEGESRGADAVGNARRHLAGASAAERDLINAMARRYDKGTTAVKYTRYADAMSAYTARYPDDANARVIAGYAIFTAYDLLDDKSQITPKAREIIADADRALAIDPSNLGAHHLRIHTMEEVNRWGDAVVNARALESFTYQPGESHLPHMAGHIWARTGDYASLVRDNETAVRNDKAWNALGDGPGQQYMRRYHDHDVDFVLYGMSTIGRFDDAQAFVASEDSYSQLRLALRLHQDLRVAQIDPGSSDSYTAFAHAIADGRRGDLPSAKVEAAKKGASDGPRGALIAAAEALGAHDTAARVVAYAKAYAATKDDYPGDPKSYWPTPIGEGYGAALLADGKPALAATVFAAELKRFPNDPHLEWGLAQALAAQGNDASAPLAAYRAHWKGSRDLTLDDLG